MIIELFKLFVSEKKIAVSLQQKLVDEPCCSASAAERSKKSGCCICWLLEMNNDYNKQKSYTQY